MLDDREREIVHSWIDRAICQESYCGFDDMHINKISWRFSLPEKWLFGSVECLDFAHSVLLNEYPEFGAAAGLALEGGPTPVGSVFTTKTELEAQYSATPPSLYIFRRDNLPWMEPNSRFLEIEDFEGLKTYGLKLYYLEYREGFEPDFRRSLWITRDFA